MPAIVTYNDDGGEGWASRQLRIRIRRGCGPILEPDGMCVLTSINEHGVEIERDIHTTADVIGITLSQKGSLYVVGFFDEGQYKEHLYPSDNVEWIEKEGDWK